MNPCDRRKGGSYAADPEHRWVTPGSQLDAADASARVRLSEAPSLLGEQRLVVGGILAECPKLLEGIVHRLRPCVQGSKVLPRIFIDPLGVSGQLVPEAIEVDALPALHQTLLVRTPEIEVPQHRAANES